jgi:hypothetical protein
MFPNWLVTHGKDYKAEMKLLARVSMTLHAQASMKCEAMLKATGIAK